MILWVAVLGFVFSALIGFEVAWYFFKRVSSPSPAGVARLMRETVIVTLKTGEAWQGVLWEDDGRVLVLRNALGLGMAERAENLPVDGELILFVSDIAYAQKP